MIEAAPKDVEAYRRRAYAYRLAGQDERALDDLKKILQLKPGDKDALARLKYLKTRTARANPPAAGATPPNAILRD